MLKLGYKASAEQFDPRSLLEFSVIAEEVGFDSVWVSDHFQPWRHNDGHAPFSLAWMAALGERTSQVSIGTSVATPTFRYHPSIVAQAFGTLGCLVPGRIILGVGSVSKVSTIAPSPPPSTTGQRKKCRSTSPPRAPRLPAWRVVWGTASSPPAAKRRNSTVKP
jgi:coenzyme F420-dependent glucose-6-phosphate dehydrogenase